MRRFLRWTGLVLAAVIVLIIVAAAAAYYIGGTRLATVYSVQTASLVVNADSTTLARGKHLVDINGCADCHASDLSGKVIVDEPPFRIVAPNLTAGEGGIGSDYGTGDFDRAIRHGVKKDGRSLLIMPSAAFHNLSDDDAAAIIAYLQQVPPVDNTIPATEVRVPGRFLVAAALFDPAFEVRTAAARSTPAPEMGPTAAYGEYLASVTCQYCHGSDLRGAIPPMPGSPPAPDLAASGQWSLDAFKHALRTGERPAGKAPMDPEFMPYQITSHMTDVELEALHAHLASLLEDEV